LFQKFFLYCQDRFLIIFLSLIKTYKKYYGGYIECAVSFCEPDKNPLTVVEKIEIEINKKESGQLAPLKSWDKILRFKGEKRTFAEYPFEEKIHIWAKSYKNLAKKIKSLIS